MPSNTAPPSALTNLQTFLIITSVSGVTLLTNFLSGALTTSLPTIAKSLSIPDDSLQWPVSMYSLTNAVFLLVFGGLADTLGRKTLFLVGTAVFAILSMAVSFATNSFSFILLMSALGLAPAILSPAGAGILGGSFLSGRTKTIAFASLGAGQPIGFITGLVAGGILSTKWRYLYWLLCGLSTAFAVIGVFCLPPDVRLTRSQIASQLKGFDWFGALLSTISATSLIFALSDAESAPNGWSTPYIPALLPTSATFMVSFLWWEEKRERDQKHVLLPLSIWKAKGLGVMVSVIFFAWMAFNATDYLCTLMYQRVQQLSPTRTAIYFLPMCGSGFFLNVLAGNLTGKVSTFKLICVGLTLSGVASVVFSTLVPDANYVSGMLWVMILSVGPDLFFSAANIHIQNSVGADQQALAGSLFMIATRVATSFGLAICSAITTARSRKAVERLMSETYYDGTVTNHRYTSADEAKVRSLSLLEGLRGAGYACLAFTIVAFAISVLGLRELDIASKRTNESVRTPTAAGFAESELAMGGGEAESPAIELPGLRVGGGEDKASAYSVRSRYPADASNPSTLHQVVMSHD